MSAEIFTPFAGSENNPALLDGKPPAPKVSKVLVATLEMFLERAKKGELLWVGLAYVGPDMVSKACFFELPAPSPQLLSASLGAAAFLNAKYSQVVISGTTEVEDGSSNDEDAED
jgi:hypothetical protein